MPSHFIKLVVAKSRVLLLLCIAMLAISRSAVAQARIHVRAVDAAVAAEMERQELVGVAVGIIRNNRVVYTQGYGMADRKNGQRMSEKTVCNWASNSKPFIAVRAMQLVEAGQLLLDKPIGDYLPDLAEHLHPITTRQLLCHQSGVPHYSNGTIQASPKLPDDPLKQLQPRIAVQRFELSPLIFEPGSEYAYSSHAYVLLSAVVEAAGDGSIFDQLRDEIIKPLRLSSLQMDMPRNGQENWTTAYERKGNSFQVVPDEAHYWKHGAGGYKSNVVDFAKFAQALMTSKLLSAETTRMMWTRQPFTSGEISDYGLGVRVSGEGRSLKIWHGGSQEETKTRMVLYPKQKHGMVIMCNTRHADAAKISTAIYKAL